MKITRNNYADYVNEIYPKLDENSQSISENAVILTDNFTDFSILDSDADGNAAFELLLKDANDIINAAAKPVPAPPYKIKHKSQSTRKTGRKAKPKGKKKSAPAPAPKAPKPAPAPDTRSKVNKVPASVAFLNRYRLLDGKTIRKTGPRSLKTIISSLQKAIEEQVIRKTDKYAAEIMVMQSQLIKLFNGWAGNSAHKIEVDNHDKYFRIVQSYMVSPLTALVKRFITLQGAEGKKKEAELLLKRINKFIETKQIIKADAAEMITSLERYLDGKTDLIQINEHALSGLMGLAGIGKATPPKKKSSGVKGFEQTFQEADMSIKVGDMVETPMGDRGKVKRINGRIAHLVTAKGISHTVPFKMLRKVNSLNGAESGIINSMDLKVMEFDSLGLEGKYRELMGNVSEPWSGMIYGAPGSGKSTIAIEFAHEIASKHNRKVAYVAKEEGIGATIQEKFARLNAFHPNIDIHSNHLPENPQQYQYIFIDSVNEFGIDYPTLSKLQSDWKAMDINPMFIFKGTKDGSFRGSQEFEHLVDVSVKTEEGIARTEKSRYGGKGALVVYSDDSHNIPKFSDLIKAEGYRNKAKNKMNITRGDDGKYWVITPAMASLMKAQGFEIF